MVCKSCGSDRVGIFQTEIAVHLDINSPLVFIFPHLLVCSNCGRAELVEEFTIPENELRLLTRRGAPAQD